MGLRPMKTLLSVIDDMVGHYKRSKFLAEREAEKFLGEGFAFGVRPPEHSGRPWRPQTDTTGKIIVDFLNRKMPAYLDTGLNLVDVRDVAEGHRLAFEQGNIGEKYILGNRNLTLAQIFAMLEKISRVAHQG